MTITAWLKKSSCIKVEEVQIAKRKYNRRKKSFSDCSKSLKANSEQIGDKNSNIESEIERAED